MERLSRLAHRIVWVNPRVSSNAFTPKAGGMAAALPYCDTLVSGHSFEALQEVVDAIGAEHTADRGRRTADPEPEPGDGPGPAPRPWQAVPWPCRAATGRAEATPRPGGSPTNERYAEDLHLSGL